MPDQTAYCYMNHLTDPALREQVTPEQQQVFADHFAYLQAALQEGKLILAGPCTDFAFGLVIFYAESREAAQDFMDNDPAIQHGLMTAELHPFKVSLLASGSPE